MSKLIEAWMARFDALAEAGAFDDREDIKSLREAYMYALQAFERAWDKLGQAQQAWLDMKPEFRTCRMSGHQDDIISEYKSVLSADVEGNVVERKCLRCGRTVKSGARYTLWSCALTEDQMKQYEEGTLVLSRHQKLVEGDDGEFRISFPRREAVKSRPDYPEGYLLKGIAEPPLTRSDAAALFHIEVLHRELMKLENEAGVPVGQPAFTLVEVFAVAA